MSGLRMNVIMNFNTKLGSNKKMLKPRKKIKGKGKKLFQAK